MATKAKAERDGKRIAATALALIKAGADKDAVLANLLAQATTGEKWKAGYRQHPDTKEWMPAAQVYAAVAAKRAAKRP